MRLAIHTIAVLTAALVVMTGCQSMTGETAGENVDDASITTAVKAKLAAEKATSLTQIGVETTLRVVHLTGVVASDANRQRAGELAGSVKGVHAIRNDIQVRGGS